MYLFFFFIGPSEEQVEVFESGMGESDSILFFKKVMVLVVYE